MRALEPTTCALADSASEPLAHRDLVEHPAIAEVRALHALPATEFGDGRELQLREALGVARGNLGIAWAVIVPGDDLLPFLAVEITEVGTRHLARAVAQRHAVDHRHRRLGKHTHRRH